MPEHWITYRYSRGAGVSTAAIKATGMSREEIETTTREAIARGGSFTLHAPNSTLIIPTHLVVDVRIDPTGVPANTFDPPRHLPPGQ